MDTSRLTTKSQQALSGAVERAGAAGNPYVEPVHVLLALLAQPDSTAIPLLDAAGVDRVTLSAAVDKLAGRLPTATGATLSAPAVSRTLYATLNAAGAVAKDLEDEYV
jgi:ATP-dependent Clp protease ATP-binding subunit ClpB